MAFYGSQHYARVSPRKETPEEIRDSRIRIIAGRQAHLDTLAKFSTITPENIRAALVFQAERDFFHRAQLATATDTQLVAHPLGVDQEKRA